MRQMAWLGFVFGAIAAFAAGADIPVEAPFDPKGGHVQGICEGEGFYYWTIGQSDRQAMQ